MDTDGVWNLYLGGVISEAHTSHDYETIVSVPAHFITWDGAIRSEDSVFVRQAIPATSSSC
jgi:hypothetical protein